MAKLLDKLAARMGYSKGRTAAVPSKRRFDAAEISRLTAHWNAGNTSINTDVRMELNLIRARSRDLVLNNDYAKKFIQMVGTHVVGPNGFQLQVRAVDAGGKQDTVANAAIESHFAKWSRRGVCDVTRKMSFTDIQQLVAKTVARDGECLVRKVYGKQANRYGFGLQVLAIDRLDVQKNEESLKNGNVIRMGVEITQYGEPVAYYLRSKNPVDGIYSSYAGVVYERVPAADIYHLYIPLEPEQIRGFPWMHSAIMRMQNLGGFEEAAVIAARVGASKMGFFTSEDGDGSALADGTDAAGNLYSEAEPGTFGVLPPGYDFKNFDPDYPTANYDPFVKACLRGIASGLGVAYNTLSNDLEGVNFSSIRTGVLEERDNWMVIQNWMIDAFMVDVFEQWLKQAMLFGEVTTNNGAALPLAKFDKFNAPQWQGRRWSWVDPKKDAETAILLVNANLKARRDVMADAGYDLEDTWTQLMAEQEMADKMGIELKPAEQAAGFGQSGDVDA